MHFPSPTVFGLSRVMNFLSWAMIASENSLIRPRHADESRTLHLSIPEVTVVASNVSDEEPNQICQHHVEPYNLEVEHSFLELCYPLPKSTAQPLVEVLFNIPSPRRVVRAHDATKRIER